MRIGVDVDDTVVNFVGTFLDYYFETTGIRIQYHEVNTYRFEEVLKCTRAQAIEYFNLFYNSAAFDRVPILEDVGAVLEAVNTKHDLIFITARHGIGRRKTAQQLKDRFPFLGEPEVYFVDTEVAANKRSKADICLAEGIHRMVEDNGAYAVECATKGIDSYLLGRPWNAGHAHSRIKSVKNWRDIHADLEVQST